MTFPPPTLEDIGWMLWGPTWEPMMAVALEVSNEKLQTWIEDPTLIPLGIEQKLSYVAKARTEEIDLAQAMLFQRGISRKPELGERANDE
jgi:hypothetical protein